MLTWSASVSALLYEIVFVGKDSKQELQEVQATDGLLRLWHEWVGLPKLGVPEVVKVRAIGENSLASERFVEAPVPNQMSPPSEIIVRWEQANDLLLVKWDAVVGANEYEICLHPSLGEPEIFDVLGVDWNGSPQPLLVAISIRALGCNCQSISSPQVEVPLKVVANSTETIHEPKEDHGSGDEEELPEELPILEVPGYIYLPLSPTGNKDLVCTLSFLYGR